MASVNVRYNTSGRTTPGQQDAMIPPLDQDPFPEDPFDELPLELLPPSTIIGIVLH
jgi:hypothetical protein